MQGEGDVCYLGYLFPVFTMGNAIRSPTVKCFRFVCENFTTFALANVSLESLIRGLLVMYSVYRSTLGFIRNLQKSNDCFTETLAYAAKLPA